MSTAIIAFLATIIVGLVFFLIWAVRLAKAAIARESEALKLAQTAQTDLREVQAELALANEGNEAWESETQVLVDLFYSTRPEDEEPQDLDVIIEWSVAQLQTIWVPDPDQPAPSEEDDPEDMMVMRVHVANLGARKAEGPDSLFD